MLPNTPKTLKLSTTSVIPSHIQFVNKHCWPYSHSLDIQNANSFFIVIISCLNFWKSFLIALALALFQSICSTSIKGIIFLFHKPCLIIPVLDSNPSKISYGTESEGHGPKQGCMIPSLFFPHFASDTLASMRRYPASMTQLQGILWFVPQTLRLRISSWITHLLPISLCSNVT